MARVVLDRVAVRKLAKDTGINLVRDAAKAGTVQAKRNAPGGPYSTGRLKGSIDWKWIRRSNQEVVAEFGSPLIYASSVHDGRPPRTFGPTRARALRFFWRRTGRWEYFAKVNHPGTEAQPYLADAILKVGPPRGFKVVIY